MKLLYASMTVALGLFAGCARTPEATARDEIADLKSRNALLDERYRQELKSEQETAANFQRQLDALARKQKEDDAQVYSDVIKAVHGLLDDFDDKLNRLGVKNDSNLELVKAEIRSVQADLNGKADIPRLLELKNRTLGEDEDLGVPPTSAPLKNQIGELARLLVADSELEAPGGLALTESKGTFEKRIGDLEEDVLAIDNRLRAPAP